MHCLIQFLMYHVPIQISVQQSKMLSAIWYVKDVQGGIPESDLLGVTVALVHVAGQRFLAV